MHDRIRVAIGVSAVAALIGAGVWWLRADAPAPDATVETATAPATVDTTAPVDNVERIPTPAPTTALPDVEAPLALVIDDLHRRAAAGEAAAACRLAAEYVHCGQLQGRRAELDRWLLERRRALDLIDSVEMRQQAAKNIDSELALRDEQLGAIEAHCKDVDVPDQRALTRMWRSAALAGDPAAMRQYASGNAFRWDGMLDSLPELATYRQEAERIALVAARRGDLDMLIALAAAYQDDGTGGRSLLQQAVRPDPAMALAMYRHIDATLRRDGAGDENIAHEVGQRIADLEAALDGPAMARADTLADGMARDWTPPVVRGAGELRAGGRILEVDRRWCGR